MRDDDGVTRRTVKRPVAAVGDGYTLGRDKRLDFRDARLKREWRIFRLERRAAHLLGVEHVIKFAHEKGVFVVGSGLVGNLFGEDNPGRFLPLERAAEFDDLVCREVAGVFEAVLKRRDPGQEHVDARIGPARDVVPGHPDERIAIPGFDPGRGA